MKFIESNVGWEEWAYAYRPGFTGDGAGLYYHYYKTREDAEKYRAKRVAKGKFAGPVEHRPGESYHAGSFVF